METIQLIGNDVLLRLMTKDDVEGIYASCQDKRIWTHMSQTLQTKEDVQAYVKQALVNREAGTEYPFVIVLRATNEIIGSTRFLILPLPIKVWSSDTPGYIHPFGVQTSIQNANIYCYLTALSNYNINGCKLKQDTKIPDHKKPSSELAPQKKGFYVII